MTVEERITAALEDKEGKDFLYSQLSTLRDNILESEKRISKTFIVILSLIGISMLMELKLIQKIGFFSTEISNIGLVLIAMPGIISYYSYSLFNQLMLRRTLNHVYAMIIESKSEKLGDLDLDDFLITHLGDSIENILIRGSKRWYKSLIRIIAAPAILIFQYLPLWYCYYLLYSLFQNENYTGVAYWTSFAVTTLFFIRGSLVSIALLQDEGGLKHEVKKILEYLQAKQK